MTSALNGDESTTAVEAPVDPLAGYTKASEKIRETAKWLVTSFAAIGAILIAGIQFSSIGSLDSHSSGLRIAATIVGLIAGGTGVALAIWFTSSVLAPFLTLLDRPADDELADSITKATIGYGYGQFKQNADKERAAMAAAQDKDDATQAEALKRWNDWDTTTERRVLTVMGTALLAKRFKDARIAIMWGVALAGIGLALFVWGTNPPKPEKTAAPPNVPLGRAPVVMYVRLKAAGVAALAPARKCRSYGVPALQVGGTAAVPEVVTLPNGLCRTIRFVVTPSLGVAIAAGS